MYKFGINVLFHVISTNSIPGSYIWILPFKLLSMQATYMPHSISLCLNWLSDKVVSCPDPTHEERVWASLKIHSLHSCELKTNLHSKKVLCHHAEVAKEFQCCYQRLCFLQCDWRSEILHRNQSTLMKPKGLAECH